MAKTAEEIIASAVTLLQQAQPTADVSEGTVLRDVLESFAAELETLYTNLDTLLNYITFSNPDTLDDATLDTIGANYGITRKAASASTGTVYFRTSSPTSVEIPSGTTVSTPTTTTTTGISFTTTETVNLSSAVYNTELGVYEVAAAISCSSTGTLGNVGIGTITVLSNAVDSVNSIYNKLALTNGTNEETNTAYVARIKNYLSGTTLGTSTAYELLFGDISGVNGVLVIDPNNSANDRGPGAVDVYLDGTTVTEYTQTVTSYTDTTVYLTKTPVLEITSIVNSLGATLTGYTFVRDTTSAYKYSLNALDKIVWDTGSVPTTQYYINYTYNSLIETAQNLETSAENHILTADVLVKTIVPVYIDIYMTVHKLSGYVADDVRTAVENAITTYVQTDRLGKHIRQSDLIDIVNAVTGVDYVEVPFTQLSIRGSSGTADLTVSYPYQYFEVDESTYSIEVE